MKRFISIALTAVFMALSIAVGLTGCGAKASEGLEFKSNGDGTCAVIGIGTCEDEDIVIPDKDTNGNVVTSIAEEAFSSSKIRSVVMADTITSIGTQAFSNSHRLETVDFSSRLESIGSRAFVACESIEKLTLPNSLLRFERSLDTNGKPFEGSRTFNGCEKLSEINIPKNVEAIYEDTFGDTNLTKVKVDADFKYGYVGFRYFDNEISIPHPTIYLSDPELEDEYIDSHVMELTDSFKAILYAELFHNESIEINGKALEVPTPQCTPGFYGQTDEKMAVELSEDDKITIYRYDDTYGKYEIDTSYKTGKQLVFDFEYDEKIKAYTFEGDFFGDPDDYETQGFRVYDNHLFIISIDGSYYYHLELDVQYED